MTNNVLRMIYGDNVQKKGILNKSEEVWKDIYTNYQHNQIMQAYAVGVEKRDDSYVLITNFSGTTIKGIIPEEEIGHIGENPLKKMRKLIGQKIPIKVKGIDRENNIVALSRKEALEHLGNITLKEIKEGDIVEARAIMVAPYQAIVDIGGIETVLPKAEISHGYVKDVRDYIAAGDVFDIKIMSIDREKRKVKISHKALLPDGWETIHERYKIEGEYVANITKLEEYGMFITLEEGISALIPLPHNKTVRDKLAVGKNVLFRIIEIDKDKRHIKGRLVLVIE